MCHPSLASPSPALLALNSLFLCVGFQICKQGDLAPKPPSLVQTRKCQWCLEAEEQLVEQNVSLTLFSCLISEKTDTLDMARTTQSLKPA